MRAKWPWVKRERVDDAELAIQGLKMDLRDRDRALSRMGHRFLQYKKEMAKEITDMRLLHLHIQYPPPGQVIGINIQMQQHMFDHFYHNRPFTELVAVMVEEAFMRAPEGRRLLAGYFGPQTEVPDALDLR